MSLAIYAGERIDGDPVTHDTRTWLRQRRTWLRQSKSAISAGYYIEGAALLQIAIRELLQADCGYAERGDLLRIMEHEYFPSKSKIASDSTEHQYKNMFLKFSKFLGRRATLDDLDDVRAGKWMRAMRKDGLAMPTINGYITKLRAFWDGAAKKRIVEVFPTIEDFPEPVRLPDAYSEEESRRLVAASAKMEGEILGVQAAAWWEGLHLVAFDFAERTSAVLDLEWRYYNAADATLEAPAHSRKGGRKPLLYHLKPQTV